MAQDKQIIASRFVIPVVFSLLFHGVIFFAVPVKEQWGQHPVRGSKLVVGLRMPSAHTAEEGPLVPPVATRVEKTQPVPSEEVPTPPPSSRPPADKKNICAPKKKVTPGPQDSPAGRVARASEKKVEHTSSPASHPVVDVPQELPKEAVEKQVPLSEVKEESLAKVDFDPPQADLIEADTAESADASVSSSPPFSVLSDSSKKSTAPVATMGAGNEVVRAQFGQEGGPRVVKMPRPKYPRRARRLHREGRVLLLLDLNRFGTLENASVLESAGFGFDEAALRAVKKARFEPAKHQGVQVACQAVLPIAFQLESVR